MNGKFHPSAFILFQQEVALSTLIETLTSYVPVLITRHLATELNPITEPTADSFPAAVLFADISGFTALTERLADQGPSGAEELTRLLNAYFGQLIDLISAHGGDVVKFAGDALLAVWPARAGVFPGLEDDLGVATQRAVQCGWVIQQDLAAYEPAEGVQLSLKLAIGTGQISALQLGGVYQRWEFLVTGNPLMQVGVAESYAQPGDVILSPEVWMLLGDDCSGELLAADNIRLEALNFSLPLRPINSPTLSPDAENALRAYIPGAILTRLAAGQSGWLAELRPITVLFINLPHLDDTVSVADAQTAMATLQDMIYRYEGSINKLSVDDKGTTLIAALGLPPLAHEDDPVRGVQAAIAIQGQLQAMQVRGAIGIASGRIYCGSVGNDRRREYTMIGNSVNLAARLMQAAGTLASTGEEGWIEGLTPILCDEITCQSAQSQIKFDALSPIFVKGKINPVAIYRPTTEAISSVVQTHGTSVSHVTGDDEAKPGAEMVGRMQEKTELAEQLQAILRGETGVIIIEGEAGIGKSRLVEDLLGHAQTVGVTGIIGAGDAIEKNTPYHAWRPLFHQLFQLDADPLLHGPSGHLSGSRQAEVLARIEAINPELMRLTPLLKTVLPLDLPDNELTAQMTGEVRADNTHELLLQILQAVVPEAPMLLIIEDAHWLDSASWALLRLVSRDVQPVMLVIATRPITDPAPAEYNHLITIPDNHHLRLEVLPIEDALTLVSRRLGVDRLPEPVANLIEERAEGHPFYSEELAYALRDAGLIDIKGGQCRVVADVSDLRELDFPDTLQGVITSRIDRLTPQQQLTLKAASVIGRVFAFRVLRDIHPIEADKPHLQDYLDALERLDLTPLDIPEPELTYIFKHIITQEVAYNLMAFAQRRKLHRAIAEWFEQTYADDLSPFYPLLAYHWRNALAEQQPEPVLTARAIDYLEKAGEQASNNFANQEAVTFFSQVLILDNKLGTSQNRLRRARWERQLGEAYFGLGRWMDSREHYKRALALLGQPVATEQSGLILSLLTQTLRQTFYRVWPTKLGWKLQFNKQLQDRDDVLLEAARAYAQLAYVNFFAEQLVPYLSAGLFSVNLAERIGPSPELAIGYANLCLSIGSVPLHAIARAYSRWALETLQQISGSSETYLVVVWTGFYGIGTGQWTDAQNLLSRGAEVTERLGDRRAWEQFWGLLAVMAYQQGEFNHSKKLFAEVYTSAHRRDDAQPQIWGLLGQVENELWLSSTVTDSIKRYLEMAEDLLTEKNLSSAEFIRTSGLRGRVYLRQGEQQLALQAAEKALQLSSQSPFMILYAFDGYAGPAEVYLSIWESNSNQLSGDNKALSKSARQACKTLQKFAKVFPITQPRAWIYQGWYDWLDGNHNKARKAWQKSLTLAKQFDMPHEQALAHYQIGRHSQGDARREYLTQAIEIFEQLGANYDLGRAYQELKNQTNYQ